MKTAFFLSLQDLRKNKKLLIATYIQVFLFTVILFISMSNLPNISMLSRYVHLLEKNNITSFRAYYNSTNTGQETSQKTKDELMRLFRKSKAGYTTFRCALPEHEDIPTLVALGNFISIFPLKSDAVRTGDEISVYIGKNVSSLFIGDTLSFGIYSPVKLSVIGYLPANYGFFQRNYYNTLDNSILILAPYKVIDKLFGESANMEIIQNISLINPSKADITQFVSAINTSRNINIIPYHASEVFGLQNSEDFRIQVFFTLYFSTALLFCFVGVIGNLLHQIRVSQKEYAIHFLYGAPTRNIFYRIFFFVVLLLLPPMFMGLFPVHLMGLLKNVPNWSIVLGYFTISLSSIFIVSVQPVRLIKKMNIQNIIRGD